jgi:phosphomannomutase
LPIKFGSDGWRGIIGEDFTLDNVARIAAAVCEWWPEDKSRWNGNIFIGYDNRTLSLEAAQHAYRVIESLGKLTPHLTWEPCPSPYISFLCAEFQRPLGIQITASHNPSDYNGVKLKGIHGGSLLPSTVKEIEDLANRIDISDIPEPDDSDFSPEFLKFLDGIDSPKMIHSDMDYVTKMLQLSIGSYMRVDPTRGSRTYSRKSGLKAEKLIVDRMHGSTRLYCEVLEQTHDLKQVLRGDRDPTFGGSKPEPLEHLLPELIQRVKDANDGTVGIAFDGDGDRLAVIDETGAYLQSHEIFALLLDYLARSDYPGKRVVTTVSFSSVLGRIADSYGLETTEVPVGFKHVSEEMLKGDVLIGGEESGGAAFGHYLPERDALLMALTLLRAKGEAGVTLHEMLRDVYARFGRSEFVHVDVQLDLRSAQEFRARIPSLLEVSSLAGESVTSNSDKDGVKLRTGDGWVLVRASGTEPLARFYAEAQTRETAQRMIQDVKARLL